MTSTIIYYSLEETEHDYNNIMEICYTMTRAEIDNLRDRFMSACRSRCNGETDNAANKIAQVRAIVDFLFETRKIDHHLMARLCTLTGKIMGINKIIKD